MELKIHRFRHKNCAYNHNGNVYFCYTINYINKYNKRWCIRLPNLKKARLRAIRCSIMTDTDFREIGASLKAAFRLSTRPLVIYGSEVLPMDIPPMTEVNRCFAVSMHQMATENYVSAIYVSADTSENCCPGGLFHVGYIPVPDEIKYFVSTGRNDAHGGEVEYLKADPELVERHIGNGTDPSTGKISRRCGL